MGAPGPKGGPGSADLARGEAPPPLLGTWRNIYLLLVAELALIAAASALLTWWAA